MLTRILPVLGGVGVVTCFVLITMYPSAIHRAEQRFFRVNTRLGVDNPNSPPAGLGSPQDSPVRPPPPATAHDLGNGFSVPVGLTVETFKANHSEGDCFSGSPAGCYLKNPQGIDCPSAEPCLDVTYTFVEGRLSGFMTTYARGSWQRLLSAAYKTFGQPLAHRSTRIVSMIAENYEWDLAAGDGIVFVQYSGADIYGQPPVYPYAVIYGPKQFIEDLAASNSTDDKSLGAPDVEAPTAANIGASTSTYPQQRGHGDGSGDYELKDAGIDFIVEVNRHGTALLVINRSANNIILKPSDIVFAAKGTTESPCGFTLLSVMGIGIAGPTEIAAGEKNGVVLGGCGAPGIPFIAPDFDEIRINNRKLHYVGTAKP